MKKVKLGDVVDIVDTLHATAPVSTEETIYKMIRTSDITNGQLSTDTMRSVSKTTYEEWSRRGKLKKGDIILSREAPMGEVGIVNRTDINYFLGQRCLKLNTKNSNELVQNYLYYVLQSTFLQKQLKINDRTGSSVGNIRIPVLKECILPIVSINLQIKISEILRSIDNKIQINLQINKELEQMARELYDYWFIQFDFPNAEGKPYKSSGGVMDIDKNIPVGWEIKKMSDLTEITTGKKDANFGSVEGRYDFWTTASSPIKANSYSFSGKSILIAGNGNFYVNFTDGKFEAYQRTYVIQSKNEFGLDIMYMAALKAIDGLRRAANGSIIKFITLSDVKGISQAYEKNIVLMFEKQISPILQKIYKNNLESRKLREIQNHLLPMLMNGQININKNY